MNNSGINSFSDSTTMTDADLVRVLAVYLMAASTLTAIPVVSFFLLVQRKIAFGLTAGAVKA